MNIEGINKTGNVHQIGSLNKGQKTSGLSSPNKINISEQAQVMDQLDELPEVSQEKIDALRAEINDPNCMTPEKLEKAMENMLQDLL